MEKAKRALEIGRACWDWLHRRKVALSLVLVFALIAFPQVSRSQIISPCCEILAAGLGSIADAISNVIGGGLNAMNSTLGAIEGFESSVVWPSQLIDRARSVVGTLEATFGQIENIAATPVASATLPTPKQLEQTLLSRDPNQVSQVPTNYAAVYSNVPPATDAPTQVRNLIDMTDAVAQAAMKRAIEIDAISDIELQAADQIVDEIKAAAPGSAPILEAGASAWLVRSNAYTQAALTELMRLRSIDLANAGSDMKIEAQQGSTLRGNVNNTLKRR